MKWVSQTKHAIELVVLFAKIQNQTLNGLSKVRKKIILVLHKNTILDFLIQSCVLHAISL